MQSISGFLPSHTHNQLMRQYRQTPRSSLIFSLKIIFTLFNYRYSIGGHSLPFLAQWAIDKLGVDPSRDPKIPKMPTKFPDSRLPKNIQAELEKIALVSVDGMDRLIRSHGQTLKDMSQLRNNSFPRIPDAVIWPESHEQVSFNTL